MREKLVRDKIPNIIRASGSGPIWVRTASRSELSGLLIEKLREEISEFAETPSLEELADIAEVLDALREAHQWTDPALRTARRKKLRDRGGFAKRFVLQLEPGEKAPR